jgi:hypothetical protein
LGKLFFIRNFVMSKIGEIVNWVNYFFIKNKYNLVDIGQCRNCSIPKLYVRFYKLYVYLE